MIVMHLSDIHGHRGMINKIAKKAKEYSVNLIIISGDITHFGSLTEFKEILEDIYAESKVRIFFIPGNCDPKEALDFDVSDEIKNLHDKVIKFSEFYFAGIGGALKSPLYSIISWSEDEIGKIISKLFPLPSDKLILVSHSPPYRTKVDFTKRGTHAGSKSLLKFIKKKQPRLVLVGHIHEGRGIDKIGKTIIVNSGPFKNGYAAVVSLDSHSVSLIEL